MIQVVSFLCIMVKTSLQLLLQNSMDSGLGKISAAAALQWSAGTPGRRMRRLDCYALVYVLAGGGRYRDENGYRSPVEPGNLLLLLPGVAHAYGPARGQRWDEIYVLFEGPVFDLWRERDVLFDNSPLQHLTPIPSWRAKLEQTWKHPDDPLDAVCRLQAFLSDVRQGQQGEQTPEWLVAARQHLEADPAHQVDLHQLARKLGMSYENFRKSFRRREGVSPGRYRRQKVMDEAARRLLRDDLPLKQVAEATGFCDEFHFSRQFKNRMGVSPGAYRRRFLR